LYGKLGPIWRIALTHGQRPLGKPHNLERPAESRGSCPRKTGAKSVSCHLYAHNALQKAPTLFVRDRYRHAQTCTTS